MVPRSSTLSISVDAPVADEQLSALLHEVYVEGGYTPTHVAEKAFVPALVRARGTLLAAVEGDRTLLGMLIAVAPGSAACRIARPGEGELHLLGVQPQARGCGIGAALVQAALALATAQGWAGLSLFTQKPMTAAQALYATAGFARTPERDFRDGEREFLTYAIELRTRPTT